MAHHGRGRASGRRPWRAIRRRHRVQLLNRQGELLASINDASWKDVSQDEASLVVNLNNESIVWKLPRVQCGEFRPATQYRIRDTETNELWEIGSVQRETRAGMVHCICTKMNEHDYDVP